MAMLTVFDDFGVDVAKDWLDIFNGDKVVRIENNQRSIKAFLKTISTRCSFAIESTNTYHELIVELAIVAKHTVFVVDAYRLSRYRDAVGVRAKTDENDAILLRRYLGSERQHLVAFKPLPKAVKRLNRLLKARAKLAQLKTAMGLSLAGVSELAITRKALIKRFDDAMATIDKRMIDCITLGGYKQDYQRCLRKKTRTSIIISGINYRLCARPHLNT